VAKAMSNYCDSLLGDPQRRYMTANFPIHVGFLADYPDVASFTVIVAISREFMTDVVVGAVRKTYEKNRARRPPKGRENDTQSRRTPVGNRYVG